MLVMSILHFIINEINRLKEHYSGFSLIFLVQHTQEKQVYIYNKIIIYIIKEIVAINIIKFRRIQNTFL